MKYADIKLEMDYKYQIDYTALTEENKKVSGLENYLSGVKYYWKQDFSDAELYIVRMNDINYPHFQMTDNHVGDKIYEYQISPRLWKIIRVTA